MPTLSVRLVNKPRKRRKCDNCFKPIIGETIRLYGMAEVGDKPYAVFLHRSCVSGREESAMLRAAELQRAPVQSEQKKALCQCKVIHSDYETQSNICCDCRKPLFSTRSDGG